MAENRAGEAPGSARSRSRLPAGLAIAAAMACVALASIEHEKVRVLSQPSPTAGGTTVEHLGLDGCGGGWRYGRARRLGLTCEVGGPYWRRAAIGGC